MAPQGRLCALTIADYMNVRNSSLTRKGKKKKKRVSQSFKLINLKDK